MTIQFQLILFSLVKWIGKYESLDTVASAKEYRKCTLVNILLFSVKLISSFTHKYSSTNVDCLDELVEENLSNNSFTVFNLALIGQGKVQFYYR